LRVVASLYIWFVRAIPQLVLLLLIFFFGALVPTLTIGIGEVTILSAETNDVIDRFGASVIGLGLYLGAYLGEIFRGGILAVPAGQFEAAKSLGMGNTLLMRRIVAPQAIRVIIPAAANEMITMFKATSLVSVIGAAELLTTVQLVYARTFQVIPLLMVACIWYLLITSVAMVGQMGLERRYGRGYSRKVLKKTEGARA
jgi:polar amino acid transport system permease protein